ncbi:MAG: hypothetical protein Q9223_003938 [Gallowayella weberi]
MTAVGANCQPRFQVEGHVCGGFATTSYANSTQVRWSNASRIPDTMTFTTAASTPMVFLTAYYGLVEITEMQHDQTILIHSAAGGVGGAAIMIVGNYGAKVFATAGSAAKKSLLIDKDDPGAFVKLDRTDIHANNSLSMRPFKKSVTLATLDLTATGRLHPDIMSHTMNKVMSLFESVVWTTVYPITTFPIVDIEEAFRLIQAHKHMEKVALEMHEEALVKGSDPLSLDIDGTYIIAGGLGGLGREVAQMISAYGARNIQLRRRRTLLASQWSKLEAELGSVGTNIRIKTCQVADATAVQDIPNRREKTMPPVHGVIQVARILQISKLP